MSNYIAVELESKNEKTASGFYIREISTDNTAPVFGKVIGLPSGLTYFKDEYEQLTAIPANERTPAEHERVAEINRAMPHDTDMELSMGDIVYVHRRMQMPKVPIGDNKFLIHYQDVICKSDFTPVNGYVLIEPEEIVEGGEQNGVIVLDQKQAGVGWIRYEGTPLKSYLHFGNKDYQDSKIGQKVYFRKTMSYKLEHDLYNRTNKVLIPVKRRDVLWNFNK